MALYVLGAPQSIQEDGAITAYRGGNRLIGLPTTNNAWLRLNLKNTTLLGQFRQNNDGPGFTGNRTTTTPDTYRPVPFKEVTTDLSAVFASYPFAESWWIGEAATEDYQNDSTLDVVAAFFPAAAPSEPIETFAAQPHYGDWFAEAFDDEDEAGWTVGVDTEQLEFLAPPEIVIPELIAAQPQPEVEWTQTEFEDYANDSTIDVTPAFFPPVIVEPIETFAAQPLAEQAWFEGEVVEDYQAAPEQLEFLAPPEAPTTELVASAPHYGEAFWPEAETEDYQADATLDLSPTFFPTAAEAIEAFAAQAYYGEWWWDEQPTEDYAADITVDITSHLVAGVETIETLAAAGYTAYTDVEPAETLEDYQHTTTLDVAPLTFAPPATIVELVPSYTTFHDLVDLLTPDTLEDWQHSTTVENVAPFAAPPPPAVYLTEGDADAAVGMQSDGRMADRLEHDTDASVGRESDADMASSVTLYDDPRVTYDDVLVTYDGLWLGFEIEGDGPVLVGLEGG
jgi:hypothetical protein